MQKTSRSIKISLIVAAAIIVVAAVAYLLFYNQNQSDKNRIVISGSQTSAATLSLFEEAFEDQYPQNNLVFLPSTSTGDGVKGLLSGEIDVAAISRELKLEELEQDPNIIDYIVYRDALGLGVRADFPVDSLTSEQVRRIHSGEIDNWAEVGGPDLAITLLDREEFESSKILLREAILGENLVISDQAILLQTAEVTADTIEEVYGAIGQVSYGEVTLNDRNIKLIAIDSVEPSVETIETGQYTMLREYGVAFIDEEVPEYVWQFLNFLYSDEVANILSVNNFFPATKPATLM